MENIPDSTDNATPKDYWVRATRSFLLRDDIDPKVKILWMTISSYGNKPHPGRKALMGSIGVKDAHTFGIYIKQLAALNPGWSGVQLIKSNGSYGPKKYDPLPQPCVNFSKKPCVKNPHTDVCEKSTRNKEKGSKSITHSPDITAIRDLILSIPIGGEATTGYALEAETVTLLSKKSKEIHDSGISMDALLILKSFYSLALDPLNEYDRATTLPKFLRKWATELKRAMIWKRSVESKKRPDNVIGF